jgi:hypothetical protein
MTNASGRFSGLGNKPNVACSGEYVIGISLNLARGRRLGGGPLQDNGKTGECNPSKQLTAAHNLPIASKSRFRERRLGKNHCH